MIDLMVVGLWILSLATAIGLWQGFWWLIRKWLGA